MGVDLAYLRTEMPWHVEYPLETFIEVTAAFVVTRRVCRAASVLYNSTRRSFAELGPMPIGFDPDLEEELRGQEMSGAAWQEVSRREFDRQWAESVLYVEDHFDGLGNRIAGEVDGSLS